MTPRRPRPPARSPTAEIRPVAGPEELERARELFTEYVASIRPARFASPPAHVVEEIAGLPGAYRPPAGTLLLAWDGATAVGAVGVRPLRDGRGELKHLYVRAPARARGLGRALVLAAVEFAARAGYAELVLDTLPEMAGAIALYASLGFHEVRAYWPNPVEDARFFALPAARTT
ncbi:MAG TPA: GNAT family N-acetyltransferase [Thermoplasmata archaeon]|nr:GNAT family N-acetyltransferase [Thermoplasmata archaeon]